MLGRPPRGVWRIARRCRCGLPQVVETDPYLDDGTPFPTFYWLTCCALVAEVSRLESEGAIREVNALLESRPEITGALETSTSAYISARSQRGALPRTDHPGGGPKRVKCLHAHLAHHLITNDNPVGAWIAERLAWTEPHDTCL